MMQLFTFMPLLPVAVIVKRSLTLGIIIRLAVRHRCRYVYDWLSICLQYILEGNARWRLANGEFHGQTPRLAVVNIGTNNLTSTPNYQENSAEEIVEGILAVCDEIHSRSPETHILVMAIFPRDKAGSPLRARVDELNAKLKAAIPARAFCEMVDIGGKFLDANGEIPLEIMPDLVHPSGEGYRIWAGAIESIVRRHLTA